MIGWGNPATGHAAAAARPINRQASLIGWGTGRTHARPEMGQGSQRDRGAPRPERFDQRRYGVSTLHDEDMTTTASATPGGGDVDQGDSSETQVDPGGSDPGGSDPS